MRYVQGLPIDPAHEIKVGMLCRDCEVVLERAAAEGNLTDELIDRETAKLIDAIRFGGFLVAPVKVDEMTLKGAALARIYSGAEVDIIRSLCADGAEIENGFDSEHIIIAGRLYSRYSLREAGRPRTWVNVDSWHAQFPKLA